MWKHIPALFDSSSLLFSRRFSCVLMVAMGAVVFNTDANAETEGIVSELLYQDGFEELLPQVFLSADPLFVPLGQSTTITWDARYSDVCTPSGGVGVWHSSSTPPPLGQFVAPIMARTAEFTLTCTNELGSSSETLIVPVSSTSLGYPGKGVYPAQCNPNVSPGTAWEQTPDTYASQFSTWPGEFGDWENMEVWTGRFLALWFETGPVATTGKMETVFSTWPGGDKPKTFSFSECPGDFSPDQAACVFQPAQQNGVIWWSTEDSPPPTVCGLQRDTRYYMNIIFAEPGTPRNTVCVDTMGDPMDSCAFQGVPRPPWN